MEGRKRSQRIPKRERTNYFYGATIARAEAAARYDSVSRGLDKAYERW